MTSPAQSPTNTAGVVPVPLCASHRTQHYLTTCVAVSPESIVIPIVSCILGFPLLALFVICCLRKRAKLARERERRRAGNCDDHGTMSMVRFSPIHRLVGSSRTRAVSLRSERAMSRAFPSLELDTVVEERSDPEPDSGTVEVLLSPDS
uniref:Uncharacterized protein n=1 Tax=Timema cristinae TaxID=61476 RepID=A0A7R9D7S3_TIMCR|nr:unnamed protein product [Timema cristinae]